MAVTAKNFIFPTGPLKPNQFDFTLDSELETHIDDAWITSLLVAVPDATDEMIRAYVCWKANDVLATQFSSDLLRKRVGHAEEEYREDSNSLQLFNDRALACKDEYERLLAALTTGDNPDEFKVVW